MKTIIKLQRFRLGLFSHPAKGGWIAGFRFMFRLNKPLHKVAHVHGMRKFRVSPELHRVKTKKKIELGYLFHNVILNDRIFVSPDPSMHTLYSVTEALDYAYRDYMSGEVTIAELREKEEMFDLVFRAVVQYVDDTAMGRKEVYERLGIMAIRK